MKTHQNNKSLWRYSLVASAIMGFMSPVYAAENNEQQDPDNAQEVETIEVTGVRKDWQSAQAIKQSADVVVDAISASDVGVLPDRSVLEAIARVPGVTMSRIAATNDSEHFGTEGTGINVRGLTFSRSEFNGRDSFSANSGRGLSFEDVSPELLGSVEVYKSPTAAHIEGGIAGTVNLITKKPFDSEGEFAAISVDASYGDFVEKVAPTYSGLYSNIIETDTMGRFGFLVNLSHSERETQSDGIVSGIFREQEYNGENVWIPGGIRVNRKKDSREREGGAVALQWENADRTIRATGEYIRSEGNLAWAEKSLEVDPSKNEKIAYPVAGTTFEFNDDGVFEKGIMTTEEGWNGNDAERQPPGRLGEQVVTITRQRDSSSLVEDFSLNVKYTPNDTLGMNFDIQHIQAETDIYDMAVWGTVRSVMGIDFTPSDMPNVDYYGPFYDGQEDYDRDNDYLTSRHHTHIQAAMDHMSQNEGEENAARFDLSYTLDTGFISKIESGIRYANRQQITRQSKYNWGSLNEAWTESGTIWLDEPESQNIPSEVVSFDNFARGHSELTFDGGKGFIFPDQSLAADYGKSLELLPMVRDPGGWTPLAERDGATGYFVPNEVNDTEETSLAFYVKANFEGDLAGFYYSGNFGARGVKLTNKTIGFLSFPDDVPEDEDDIAHKLPEDQQKFGNNAYFDRVAEHDYSTILPSLNVKVDLVDDVIFRLGLSKSIALPELGYLRNHVSISGTDMTRVTEDPETVPEGEDPEVISAEYQRYTGSAGNPGLKPLEANNLDLTLEWYFAESGSLTSAYFYKDLTGYFVNGNRFEEFTNNGVTKTVQLQGATNGGEGSIQGFELAYQQFYDMLPAPFDGLGIQFNYTYIDENGAPNSGLKSDFPVGDGVGNFIPQFDNLPLEGVSKDNVNFVAMYEKYGWTGRIAYSWRSDYLLTSSDVRSQRPTFNAAAGYLDASLFYDFNEHFKIGIQGTNLADTINKTEIMLDQQGTRAVKGNFMYDRNISLVFRAIY